jgi:hypothetical protein
MNAGSRSAVEESNPRHAQTTKQGPCVYEVLASLRKPQFAYDCLERLWLCDTCEDDCLVGCFTVKGRGN